MNLRKLRRSIIIPFVIATSFLLYNLLYSRMTNAFFKSTVLLRHQSANETAHTIKVLDKKASDAEPWPPFPWPERRHAAANYFLNRTHGWSFNGSRDILVYLHQNKAGGSTTKHCLAGIVRHTAGRFRGQPVRNEFRILLEAQLSNHFNITQNTFGGGFAFGLCDRFSQPCAYFTTLRDPYDRTMSSYWFCKNKRAGVPLCMMMDPKKVSPRDWAIQQGSFFFRQLLYQPEFCSNFTRWDPFIELPPHQLPSNLSLRDMPCTLRQKLIMELALKPDHYERLLQYCLKNLEKWFAVIMLIDEYDLSLKMLSKAFGLPFYERCKSKHDNKVKYKGNSTIEESLMLRSKQLQELRDDPEIRSILRADELIYRKGVEIFNRQREVLENN